MNTSPRAHLIDWLRNAHAMERQAEQMLRAQASRIENYPALKSRVELHLQETLGQQKIVESCLQRYDASPSATKDFLGQAMAFGQALTGVITADEVIKSTVGAYAFKNIEIATYTQIIAAATVVGDLITKEACERILPEERAMAAWLLEHLPEITTRFIELDAAGGRAKR
jgi:ferritin-like metal-binding protein YciE